MRVETDLPVEHVQLGLMDAGSSVDGSGLRLQDTPSTLHVRAETAARPFAPVVAACRRGRRRRGVVVSGKHCRPCRMAPLRLGGRAVVEHVHTPETQPAETSRGTVGQILLQIRRCVPRRWFETCPRRRPTGRTPGPHGDRTPHRTRTGPSSGADRSRRARSAALSLRATLHRAKRHRHTARRFPTRWWGELWLAGDGPLRSLLEGEAKGDPRIRFLGYADEGSLPDLDRQADVLVVPSLFEPWGLVVHEGLA
jgi:hypothetical protein